MLDDSVPDDLILDMIDDSYDLVVKGLRRVDRLRIRELTADCHSSSDE